LPNSTIWYTVAQLYDMVLRRHTRAQHVFWSTSFYILLRSRWMSFIMLWYTMWHLLLYDIDCSSGGYMLYNINISYFVYINPLNCVYISSLLSTTFHDVFFHEQLLPYGREFIGTPVRPDLSMFHSVSVWWLRYLSAPYMISSRYSITWWNCYYCYDVRSIEPPVIRWLSGLHVMISSQFRWFCA